MFSTVAELFYISTSDGQVFHCLHILINTCWLIVMWPLSLLILVVCTFFFFVSVAKALSVLLIFFMNKLLISFISFRGFLFFYFNDLCPNLLISFFLLALVLFCSFFFLVS